MSAILIRIHVFKQPVIVIATTPFETYMLNGKYILSNIESGITESPPIICT